MHASDSPHPDPLPQAGEGGCRAVRRLAQAALLAVALAAPAAACPDLADAPSSHWSLRAEHGVQSLVTPCGDAFYSTGINVLDGEIPKRPMPDHLGYDWHRYY